MLKYICFIVYGIFYTTATQISFGRHNGKEKSVNLALETVFEFDEEDKRDDVNILSKVQKFIGKMKNVIEHNNGGRRNAKEKDKNIFTNFVGKALRILNKYDDNDLEQLASIVGDEMKKRNYEDSKLHELTENIGAQNVVAGKLAEIKNKPAADIRRFLAQVSNKIEEAKYKKPEKELLDTVNSIYTVDSVDKINSFLTDLDNYRLKSRKNLDLSKIVSGGLKDVVYDHYSELNVNLRSSVMSKVQDFVQHLYNTLGEITPQPDYIETTVKTTRKSRTINYERKWTTSRTESTTRTHKTRPPHNVPTTKGIPYEEDENEDDDENERENDSRNERTYKKHRFSKVSKEYDPTPKHKKYKTETPDIMRTMRQMYVEKNMDLKYDPDAYDRLTTEKISKRVKARKPNIDLSHSPTTRKHVKNTRKKQEYTKDEDSSDDDDTDESNRNRKENKPVKEFMIQLSTEVHFPTFDVAPKKLTKTLRNFANTVIDKNIEYINTDRPDFKSNTRKLTFKTLYPTFVNDWSATKPAHSKRVPSEHTPKRKVKIVKHGSTEELQQLRRDSGLRDIIQSAKDLNINIEIKTERTIKNSRKSLQNFRHHSKHNKKNPLRNHRVNSEKAARQRHENIPVLRHRGRPTIRRKQKVLRDPLILAKRMRDPRKHGRNNYRRYYSKPPSISEEGLSIDRNNYMNHNMFYRRNDNLDTAGSINDNKHVLRRIMKLESELELVKTQIMNETSILSSHNNDGKLSTPNSDISKVTQIETTSHNAKVYDHDIVTTMERIDAGGLNMEIPTLYNNINVDKLMKQSSDLNTNKDVIKTQVAEVKLSKSGSTTNDNLSITTNTLKEVYTPNIGQKETRNKVTDVDSNRTPQKLDDFAGESKSKQPVKEISEKKADADIYFRSNNNEIDNNAHNVTSFETVTNKYESKPVQIRNATDGNANKKTLNEQEAGTKINNNKTKDNKDYHDTNFEQNSSKENVQKTWPVFRSVDEFPKSINLTQGVHDTTGKEYQPMKIEPTFGVTIDDITNDVSHYSTNNRRTTVIALSSKIMPNYLEKQPVKGIKSHNADLPSTKGNEKQNGGKNKTEDDHVVSNTVTPSNIKIETFPKQEISISPTKLVSDVTYS